MSLEGQQSDQDQPRSPDRRAFLKNVGAAAAIAAAGPLASLEAQAAGMIEKLPPGCITIPQGVFTQHFKDAERLSTVLDPDTISTEHLLDYLHNRGIVDTKSYEATQQQTHRGLLSRWEGFQKMDNKLFYFELQDFPGDYMVDFRNRIPIRKIKTLYLNIPALQRFIADPRSQQR